MAVGRSKVQVKQKGIRGKGNHQEKEQQRLLRKGAMRLFQRKLAMAYAKWYESAAQAKHEQQQREQRAEGALKGNRPTVKATPSRVHRAPQPG